MTAIHKEKGMGRRYAPDPRDRRFGLAAALPVIPTQVQPGHHVRKFPWRLGPILDQGSTEQCTVYSAVGLIQAAPRLHLLDLRPEDFTVIYDKAQLIDEFTDTPPAGGTSERAVQKVLQDEKLTSSYLWCTDEATARTYLLTRGMLLFGTDWFTGMDQPDAHGYVSATGSPRGGHEFIVRWYYNASHKTYPDTYEFVNSWGEGWGDRGLFRMKAADFAYLFLHLNGDLCSPVEPLK